MLPRGLGNDADLRNLALLKPNSQRLETDRRWSLTFFDALVIRIRLTEPFWENWEALFLIWFPQKHRISIFTIV